ncbi:hemicentin-1 isoform X2 [Eurytemora carolleeae]|uniref:hemicentin-1 isoform X2 n=1 Tax=Eurytemora carolleeae TaxID=1294199 RepID=UPI000C7726EC|nr:hemicentin-1 isoform X2 [Eurytemora carolleeae]|eukprot:XP_023319484.1 hemicentin-1-like isoform X2 [Eurytemora affinis]
MMNLPLLCLIALAIPGKTEDIQGTVDGSLSLVCPHDLVECGEIHSIKWYRNTDRLFVYSPFSDFRNSEGTIKDRSTVIESESSSDLIINDLLLTDNGNYRCEITYMDVSASCQTVYHYSIAITAFPRSVVLSVGDEIVLEVGTEMGTAHGIVGPYRIGAELELKCQTVELKPQAGVVWFLDDKIVQETASETSEIDNELFATTSTFILNLDKNDLALKVSCRIKHDDEVVVDLSLEVDVIVPPEKVELFVPELTAGEENELECRAEKSKPPAVISWLGVENMKHEIVEYTEREQEADTYLVRSRLAILPSAENHNSKISCIIEHPAFDEIKENTRILVVKYAPVVRFSTSNQIVKEGDMIELSCFYHAYPTNISFIRWFHNSNEVTIEMVDLDLNMDDREMLVLSNVTRNQAGEYHCLVSNEVGTGTSETVLIDILYPPMVELTMDFNIPLVEGNEDKITLVCSIIDGNPANLSSVLWFQDTEQIMESIDCEPRTCMLNISGVRQDSGNYSCAGINLAGLGVESNFLWLDIQYAPNKGSVELNETYLVKNGKAALLCQVDDLGNPSASEFEWKRNEVTIPGVKVPILNLNSLSSEMRSNFSCSAINSVGNNFGEEYFLDILAPPEFLRMPDSETIIIKDNQQLNITCQVECYPLCSIDWYWNSKKIEENDVMHLFLMRQDATEDQNLFQEYELTEKENYGNDENNDSSAKIITEDIFYENSGREFDELFFIHTENFEDVEENKFPSVISTLSFKMGNWTYEVLNEFQFSTFSCLANSNGVGDEISANTTLIIEHPPLQISLSTEILVGEEGNMLKTINCSSQAYPASQITWRKENTVISEQDILEFLSPATREMSGDYICEATNIYGSISETVKLDVHFVPSCYVTLSGDNSEDNTKILACTAEGNPQDFVFWWQRKNITFEGQVEEGASLIRLKNVNDLSLYSCFVNNTVGQSEPCHLTNLEYIGERSNILVIVISTVLILCIMLFILCFFCCKNRKALTVANQFCCVCVSEKKGGNIQRTELNRKVKIYFTTIFHFMVLKILQNRC